MSLYSYDYMDRSDPYNFAYGVLFAENLQEAIEMARSAALRGAQTRFHGADGSALVVELSVALLNPPVSGSGICALGDEYHEEVLPPLQGGSF